MKITLGAIVVFSASALWCFRVHDSWALAFALSYLALLLVRLPQDCIEDDEHQAAMARLDATIRNYGRDEQ